jgi:ABC-type antimicrobial peptide transport system permease subunit
VSRRAAQAAVDALFEADAAVMLVPYTGLTPEMQQGMTRLATLLRSAAGAVFVIACANLAVFLLSRAASRSRDTSLRMALGATRRRLANAVLVEGTLIAVAGATAGALVALWTSDIVPALLFAADAESLTFTPNVGALVASAALSSVLIVAFGMVPLLENRHDTPGAVLRREPRQPSKPLARLRAALVVIQISTCCALVISAVALTGALDRAVRTTAAERLGRPILATVESRWRFERPDLGREYFRAVEQTLAADPRILSLAWTSRLPGAPALWSPVIVEPPALPARTVTLIAGAFTRDSLDEVVLPPVRGRMFGRVDTANSCKVAVALQGTADSLFGDAVGRVVYNTSGEPIEIVGTVQRAAPPGEKRPDGADIYLYGEQGLLSTPSAKVDLGVPVLPPPGRALLDTRAVSHNYFSSMGLSLRAGTLFDAVPSGRFCRVAVINQQAADTYFAGNAVGGAVIDGSGIRTAIVGVVEDPPVRTTQRRPEPSMYLPMEQEFSPKMHLILGSEDASADLQALVLQRVLAIDGGRSDSTSVMSLDERLRATALAAERIAALLFSAASASALAIGILGLYRVLTDDVLVRQREIAVRSAVGAQRWRLIAMVAAHGARLLAIGAALGTLAALLLTRWLGVGLGEESGPMPWLAGPGLLAIAGLAASVLPARRILAVDPLVAMRHE